jgi:hypothetical protein
VTSSAERGGKVYGTAGPLSYITKVAAVERFRGRGRAEEDLKREDRQRNF